MGNCPNTSVVTLALGTRLNWAEREEASNDAARLRGCVDGVLKQLVTRRDIHKRG